ncbi:hypothetical protein FVB32_15445 [Flagellimonas hymeniacidonis]|uniref:Phenylacetate-CoA ligase n=1 Tax=Flagellimonas hymeniacidonis TaxID=2603628 RepID=A0A5C8V347_9FLAO|nr:hypothetical protein [Flagellimonas hymeniacidonis]TXN35954.1 hypothetical protein FVB32_15445 [Flagellimonas hymeniacidonis]
MFLQDSRRRLFLAIDFLKGNQISKNIEEIDAVVGGDVDDPNTFERVNQNLKAVMKHATSTVPFYRQFDGYELGNFPIINKNTILNDYDNFLSQYFNPKKLYKASSSGSTGVPFTIFQDRGKKNRNTSDVVHFSESVGGQIGIKYYYFKLWDHTNKKSNLEKFLQNIHQHNVMDSGENEIIDLAYSINRDQEKKVILGYPSFLERICDVLEKEKIYLEYPNLESVITFGEGLNTLLKQRLTKVFKTEVYARYSNNENGILAQQTSNSPEMYKLNWGSYFFEFLALDSDRPSLPGELGRIVVTDLFNYAMPMIRYDTGDTGIVHETTGVRRIPSHLSEIFGRRADIIFDLHGNAVSPFIFYMVLEFGEIRQYQFIQNTKNKYMFRLVAKADKVKENEIVRYFKNVLGEKAQISFDYFDQIPILASGKWRKVINAWRS